jgi:hypothetical protein
LSSDIIHMGRRFDKIIGWTALGLLAAGVIGYYYLAYGPDIAKTIDDIQKGKV